MNVSSDQTNLFCYLQQSSKEAKIFDDDDDDELTFWVISKNKKCLCIFKSKIKPSNGYLVILSFSVSAMLYTLLISVFQTQGKFRLDQVLYHRISLVSSDQNVTRRLPKLVGTKEDSISAWLYQDGEQSLSFS